MPSPHPFSGKDARVIAIPPDAEVRETPPSITTNLDPFSYQLTSAQRGWDGYSFGWTPTDAPVVDGDLDVPLPRPFPLWLE